MYKSIYHNRSFATKEEAGVIEFGLCYIKGNELPYFSVTASGKPKKGGGGEFGGCCHELVLDVAPDLAPLIDLHLSDINGAPMHADANGWYWMAGHLGGLGQTYHGCNGDRPKSSDEALEIFAKHARVSTNEARGLAVFLLDTLNLDGPHAARQAFSIWIAAQRPRWKAEAEKAIADFGLSDHLSS